MTVLAMAVLSGCAAELGAGDGVSEACAVVDGNPYSQQFDCALVVDCGGHGSCRGSDFACTCDEGWTGLGCDRCAPTHVEVGGDCVDPCGGCPGDTRCNGDAAAPSCECDVGRAGEACRTCVSGFEEVREEDGTITCLAEACTTTCGTDRRCVVRDDGSESCDCRTSYVEDERGACISLPAIDNGDFSGGCDGWSLVRGAVNAGSAVAEILRGDGTFELHLRTSDACSVASALATVNIPGDVTLPDAAIQFRARGSEGDRLRVATSRTSDARQAEIIGTGRTETVRVCVGPAAQRVLDFTVGLSASNCLEASEAEFFIDDVTFVSAPDCRGPEL